MTSDENQFWGAGTKDAQIGAKNAGVRSEKHEQGQKNGKFL